MFKVITELVTRPHFFLLCDNRNCCTAHGFPLDRSSRATVESSQSECLRTAVQAGWIIGLEAQLCPEHAARLKQQMEKEEGEGEGEKLVQVAPANGMTEKAIERMAGEAERLRGKPTVKPH